MSSSATCRCTNKKTDQFLSSLLSLTKSCLRHLLAGRTVIEDAPLRNNVQNGKIHQDVSISSMFQIAIYSWQIVSALCEALPLNKDRKGLNDSIDSSCIEEEKLTLRDIIVILCVLSPLILNVAFLNVMVHRLIFPSA